MDNLIYDLIKELYPICRSITGNGVRETLNIIKLIIPINIKSVSSGEQIYDWKIPKEWNINNAYIIDSDGNKLIDFKKNNLHVVNYSQPVDKIIEFSELKKHIHTIEEFPEFIPYLTTYYKDYWGFCMKYNQFKNMKDGKYKVKIDSKLEDGELVYADLIIKGKTTKEILLSTYICHPSLCNDNLSGISILTYLTKWLLTKENYYTYRIVFVPETIGSITYINKNVDILKKNVIGGYVLTCLGDSGNFTYLMTQDENNLVDRITLNILKYVTKEYKLRKMYDSGSDERQYNFPNVNLKIGSLMRTKYTEFEEYHTSADNLSFINSKSLNESYDMYIKCIEAIENNIIYTPLTICEPKLDKYGLYSLLGGERKRSEDSKLIRVILYYLDGEKNLLQIAEKLEKPIYDLYNTINLLKDKYIIEKKVSSYCKI